MTKKSNDLNGLLKKKSALTEKRALAHLTIDKMSQEIAKLDSKIMEHHTGFKVGDKFKLKRVVYVITSPDTYKRIDGKYYKQMWSKQAMIELLRKVEKV